MTYQEITQFMAANHIYADVSDSEFDSLATNNFMIIVDGIRYIGTDVPVDALLAKEISAA